MATIPEITDRLEAATIKAEGASEIQYKVANGDASTSVDTASGPTPSIKKWYQELGKELEPMIASIPARLDKAALVYKTIEEVNDAASGLPDETVIIIEGISQGFIAGGAYIPSSSSPAVVLNNYDDFANYSGKYSFFQLTDKDISGIFTVIPGDETTPSDGGIVFVLQDGRRVRRIFNGPAQAAWFGLVGDYNSATLTGTDNWQAIERIIKYSADSGNQVYIEPKAYGTSKPITLNSKSGDVRNCVQIFSDSKPDIFAGRGAVFYVNSGTSCIEVIDSYHCGINGIGFRAVGSTSVGIVAARGTFQTGPGHHIFKNCVVYAPSNPSMNNGIGSIGSLNVACEETIYDNCDFWAALPHAQVTRNEVNVVKVTSGTGAPIYDFNRYSYTSAYGVPLVSVASSNTVFNFTNGGRLIALNFQSPNLLLETASDVDMGHIFMQRVLDPADPSATRGEYEFGIQALSVWGLKWRGTIEHCEAPVLILGEMTNTDLNITVNTTSSKLAEVVFCEPPAGDRDVWNTHICVRNGNGGVGKIPVRCYRSIPGKSLFKMRDSSITTTSKNTAATVDKNFWGILYSALSSTFSTAGIEISCNQGSYSFKKKISHSSSNALLNIYMPDTGAAGRFYASLVVDAVTNLVPSTAAAESVLVTRATGAVLNSNTGFGPILNKNENAVVTANTAPSVTSLTGLTLSMTATPADGSMVFALTPVATGSNMQPFETEASVTVTASRSDGLAALVI